MEPGAEKDSYRRFFYWLGKAVFEFGLIEDGDDIVLGISGGKDSLVMSWALALLKKRAPVSFALSAVTIDPGAPLGFSEQDTCKLASYFRDIGVPYKVVSTNIARILDVHPTTDTACSLCANLRRGALYKAAKEQGSNKVALGHHLDDAIETFFLNMFYQGNLRCFHPKTFLSRTGVWCIRPLAYISESETKTIAQDLNLPVVSPVCPLAGKTRRQDMKCLSKRLSKDIPGFRNQLRGVLKRLWLP